MLKTLTILIVEDQPLVALELADAVSLQGGKVIGPIQTAAHALEILAARAVDGAILDAMLPDGDVTPVGLALLESGIPFIVHSGTGMPKELAAAGPHVPLVLKPALAERVADRLAAEMAQSVGFAMSKPAGEG